MKYLRSIFQWNAVFLKKTFSSVNNPIYAKGLSGSIFIIRDSLLELAFYFTSEVTPDLFH